MPKSTSDATEELSLSFGTPESAADALAVSAMLNALVVLVDEAKQEVAPQDSVAMRVRPFREGSLEIPIGMIVVGATTLFTFNPAISSILNTVKQFLEVKKLLKGRPIEDVKSDSGLTVGNIHVSGDHNVINIIQSERVSDAVGKAFVEAEKDKAITHVSLKNNTTGENIVRIDRDEFRYFHEPEAEDEEEEEPPEYRVRGVRTGMTIKQVVLQGKAKWKFTYEGNTISADIKDEGFLQRVKSRAEIFAAGDRLIVDLEIAEKLDEATSEYERTGKYTIAKVHEHKVPPRGKKQREMFDGDA